MATPLWSNHSVQAACSSLLSFLETGVTLQLFQNVFSPVPSSPLSAFHVCNFTGYSGIPLSTVWTGPTLVQDGQYQLDSGILLFTCTGGSPQTIAGWYMRTAAFLIAAEAFTTPLTISSGQQFQIQLRPQVISQSIL